jgi:hypothetical protein
MFIFTNLVLFNLVGAYALLCGNMLGSTPNQLFR